MIVNVFDISGSLEAFANHSLPTRPMLVVPGHAACSDRSLGSSKKPTSFDASCHRQKTLSTAYSKSGMQSMTSNRPEESAKLDYKRRYPPIYSAGQNQTRSRPGDPTRISFTQRHCRFSRSHDTFYWIDCVRSCSPPSAREALVCVCAPGGLSL